MKKDIETAKCEMIGENGPRREVDIQEDYKIYEYLKKNPGVFAGTGAAFIAILSALLTFCSYMYEKAVLKYWNIDPIHISISSANRLYETIAAFVFISTLLLIVFAIDILAEQTSAMRRKELYLKSVKTKHWREMLKLHLQKIISCPLCKTKSNISRAHTNEAKEAIKQLESNIAKAKKEIRQQIVRYSFLLSVVLAASMCIFLCIGTAQTSNSIAISMTLSVIASPILVGALYLSARNAFPDKKDIREKAIREYMEQNIQSDVPAAAFPLKKILSGEYSIKQPDYKIKRALPSCLLLTVIVVAVLILSFYFLGHKHAKSCTQFMITTQNGIEYAVIYNSGDNVIVSPCQASKNVLVIDSSFQKVISLEGLEYEVRQYEDAEVGSILCDTRD